MDIATTQARLSSSASTFLAGKHQLLIDGKWCDAKSGKSFDVFDPATGQAIAAVAEADAADIDEAVKSKRRGVLSKAARGREPRPPIDAS